MTEQADFALGDNVLVDWGLDEVKGRVVSLTVGVGRVDVDVAVEFPDSDESEVITVPAGAVKPLGNELERDPNPIVGRWLDTYHYQEELGKALERALSGDLDLDAIQSNVRARDSEIDLIAGLEDGTVLVVEAKKFSSPTPRNIRDAVTQLTRSMSRFANSGATRTRGLVVFGGSMAAGSKLSRQIDADIAVSYWRGPADDEGLRESIEQLLG